MTIDIERQPTGSVPSVLALRGASWEAAAHDHPNGTVSRVSKLR